MICAIPNRLIQLLKSHLSHDENKTTQVSLMLSGTELTNIKCNNKHVRQTLQQKNKTEPSGWFLLEEIKDINWRRAWL